ncbi:hypothetical protein ACFRAM_27600 [Paenibacillus sp. NPDC056722]|uniref:hypothetical protein n=1 Tax=Paenibacillus sp. NPDC056722 TaxID=3345924 RepID=UPI00368F92AF
MENKLGKSDSTSDSKLKIEKHEEKPQPLDEQKLEKKLQPLDEQEIEEKPQTPDEQKREEKFRFLDEQIKMQLPISSETSVKESSVKATSTKSSPKQYPTRKNNYNDSKGKASSKKDASIAEGYLLEYRIKRLMFYMGYFSTIGIDLRSDYDANSDKITDLDVYGVYVHKDFTTKTIWADCKSGGVEVHKRISWIKGIMGEAEIDDVIFVSPKARTSVKEYARKSGIQIMDVGILDKLEQHYGIAKDDWHGSWNHNKQYNKSVKLSKFSIPSNAPYRNISKFITSDYWVLDNYSRVKKSITALRELALVCELPLSKDDSETVKWAIYELVTLFLLAVLNISKELYYFSDEEKQQSVLEGLSSSDIPNKRRKEMFDTALRIAFAKVKSMYPNVELPDKLPDINLVPPNYFEAFTDLILRVTNNPFNYYDLLRYLDYTLMEYELNSNNPDNNKINSLFNNSHEIIFGAKTVLNFIVQTTKIPRSYFNLSFGVNITS